MSTTAWIIAGVAAYLLFFSPQRQGATAAPAPQPGIATVSGGATRIAIPGVGEYVNVAGGQSVSVTLDPNFLSLFGG